MFVCFNDFFYGQKNIHQEGHSIDISRTTFVSTLASFVTEIFHECCPFRNTPLPLDVSTTHVLEYEMWITVSYGHWNAFFKSLILATKHIL